MYDLIIIGAGSAGLPAGMYASRYQLKNLIIGEMPGGALATSHCVENYPGVLSAPGGEIMKNFREHAEKSGSEILQERVDTVTKLGENHFSVTTNTGKTIESKRILLATWNNYKQLGVPGEKEFYGQGVSYCATCDGNFYKNLIVGMAWGGNTAVTEALYLAEIAKEVHIFVRWEVMKAENIWIEKAKQKTNIFIHYNTEIAEIQWSVMGVTGVVLKNGELRQLDWLFVAIGSTPITHIVDNLQPEKDEEWCLVVDSRQETCVKGLYAAGDVTTNSHKFRQTIMSAAEWCLAAHCIHEDLM